MNGLCPHLSCLFERSAYMVELEEVTVKRFSNPITQQISELALSLLESLTIATLRTISWRKPPVLGGAILSLTAHRC